jgi:1,4-alpha-glucan branching enzyme
MRKPGKKKMGSQRSTKGKAAKKSGSGRKNPAEIQTIKKRYLKAGDVCKVSFRLPRVAAGNARTVSIVGDFNEWDASANPMKKFKSGDHTITLDLKTGNEYQFRYLIDETRWENNWKADRYVQSPVAACENSVVVT